MSILEIIGVVFLVLYIEVSLLFVTRHLCLHWGNLRYSEYWKLLWKIPVAVIIVIPLALIAGWKNS